MQPVQVKQVYGRDLGLDILSNHLLLTAPEPPALPCNSAACTVSTSALVATRRINKPSCHTGDWDDAASWAPLLKPALLEGLWRRVLALWQAAGFMPSQRPAAAANPDPGPLRAYLRTGRLPSADELYLVLGSEQGAAHPADVAWLQELFCAFLALTGAPRPAATVAAAARARAANPAADPVLLLPALAEGLPGTPPEALAHLAACLPLG